MNCRFLGNTNFNIVSLITDYREYLDTRGYLLKVEEYFMGINDTSYCALEKDVASYQVVLDSLATPAQVYDLDLEKIAELEPDLIIMNIRHDNVYDQMCEIAPTVMLDDDISYVNWRGRFQQLGEWFGKEDVVEEWLANFDTQAAEYAEQLKAVTGNETFAVIEDNSVRSGTYYVYSTGGPGELIYDALELPASSGVPEDVWGEEVDAEYFSQIDADHILYFSDDGTVGDTADLPTWQNLKAVQAGNVYCGVNEQQYDLAYTPNGKLIYMERIVNAILNHQNIDE